MRSISFCSMDAEHPTPPPPDALPDTEPEVVTLLLALPELVPAYIQLVEAADGDPGAAAVFEEAAAWVGAAVERVAGQQAALRRCLAAVEQVARTSPEAEELVGWSFLDQLPPPQRQVLAPLLGSRTRALARELDEPGG